MEIESLFEGKDLEAVIDRSLAWFSRGEKSEDEIVLWLKVAHSCNLINKNKMIPLVLLEQLCLKTSTDEKISKSYMETAACFYHDKELENPIFMIRAATKKLGLNESELMKAYVEKSQSLSVSKEDKAAMVPSTFAMSENVEQEEKRKVFLKGALTGFVAGICFTLAIFAGVKMLNQKPLPTETQDSIKEEAPSTESPTETEKETEPESTKEEVRETTSYAAVYSESGTVKIRIGPSKEYRTVALVYGKEHLPFKVGNTVKDDSGENMIWTEIYIDDYVEAGRREFEILDPGYVEAGRVYYIASQFLEKIEE